MGLFDRAKDIVYTPLAKTTAHYIREMARTDMEKSAQTSAGGIVLGPPIRRSAAAANMYDPGLRRKPDSAVSFETLRRFAKTHEISRICINARKRQISSLEWDIVPVDPEDKTDYTAQQDLIRAYFKNLGGYRVRFRELQDTLIEDLLTLDAGVLYKQRNVRGDIEYYMPIDGATIKLRVDEQGNTPMPPEPAYIQYIKGNLTGEFTADEMIYEMMNPRSDSPYGLAPLESLILIVTSALKGTLYNLDYLTAGNVPEGFLSLPEEWGTKQIEEYMNYFDSLVSGDSQQTTKIKPIPGSSTYTPTKKRDDMAFKEFNEWLLKVTCAMFDVQPQEIGFTMDVNRATGTEQNDIATRRGILPLTNLLSEIWDDIIQVDLGFPHLKFKYYGLEDRDQLLEAKVQQIHAQTGIRSIDEIRKDDLGLDPLGISQPYVIGQATFLTPSMIANDMETPPNDPQSNPTPTEAHDDTTAESGDSKLIPAKDPGTSAADPQKSLTVEDEYKRLEKYAVRRIKLGKAYRPFESDILDDQIVHELNHRLEKCDDANSAKTIIETYRNKGEALFLAKAADDSGTDEDYKHNPYFDALIATTGFSTFQNHFKKAIRSQAKWTADQLKSLEAKYIGEDLKELTPEQQANLKAFLYDNMPPISSFIEAAALVKWYTKITNTAINDLYTTLGSDVKFKLSNPTYIASLEQHANELLSKSSLDNTTRKQLADIIIQGRQAGMTVQELSTAIDKDFADISSVRAKMIAYTETANTLNQSQYDVMQRAGVMEKEWLGFGPNICPMCLMNVGDGPIPMDSYFSSGDLMPSAHVNCECGLDYVTVDISLTDLWDGE